MPDLVPVFRFAPSPNGFLHLGHAYSALLNAKMARETGGRLLLRIEDIDVARCRPEYEGAIYEDLAWIGFNWEEPEKRESFKLCPSARSLTRPRPHLSLLLHARQYCTRDRRPGGLAARSRRFAALSGNMPALRRKDAGGALSVERASGMAA